MKKQIDKTTTHIVRGIESDGIKWKDKDITVRITSDVFGMSISMSNEEDKMFTIRLEPIISRLKEILR